MEKFFTRALTNDLENKQNIENNKLLVSKRLSVNKKDGHHVS